jgi:hypothetical protein
MATDASHCGTFNDHSPSVQMRQWPIYADRGVPSGAHLATVPGYPPETRVGFQSRRVTTGYDGFGNIAAPGVNPGWQLKDPMRLIDNRSRQVWTGPLSAQEQWPRGATPRGGVLDGNTLNIRGQSPTSAFYHGASPQVMLPPDRINVMPNPLNQEPVPQVGWGIYGAPGVRPTGPAAAERTRSIQRLPQASSARVPQKMRAEQARMIRPVRQAEVTPRGIRRYPTTFDSGHRHHVNMPACSGYGCGGFGSGPDGLGG